MAFNSVIGQVFIEPQAPAAERYKLIVAIFPADRQVKRYRTLLSSPNGLRWTKPERNVVAPDTLDIHLFTSNDSIEWQRRGDHVPFLGLGMDGAFDSRSLYPGVGYAVVGSEIWFYYSAFRCTHVESLDGPTPFEKYLGAITRATLRLDGFVSASAGHEGGEIRTRPITFTGDHLELNVDCSAGGYLNVELQTLDGRPVPGHALDDCDRLYHNHVRKTVTWKGERDLSAWKNRPLRLRFVMRDCRLYALQFATSPP